MPFGSEIKEEKKPCRTCTDFKTWAKNQNNVYRAKLEDVSENLENLKREHFNVKREFFFWWHV